MIKTILIANRGEIASRIIRTCRKMGIRTIAIFSEADRQALFVEQADLAVFIGADSYLHQGKILEIAQQTGADAIHPGYGFLAEDAGFARLCCQEGMIFIGPHAGAMEAMSSKAEAKSLMKKHGVPVIPGYQGKDQSIGRLTGQAQQIGFPVLLKATAGGGGKGMRIVREAGALEAEIRAAKREAESSFGNGELLIEKYIGNGRHIEFQIFGDQHGNVIHLLERECTIQRRYQKVIEESPSPVMDPALRKKMSAAAINVAKALNYDNAGTVEFIFNEQDRSFYFLEVNTRLQVEHPVTEEITGLDLVRMQIESAQGLPLSVTQDQIMARGYAVEARLYAEDPSNDFLPGSGVIQHFKVPGVEGLRMETAVRTGYEIPILYDPMIAKIIVWDKTRAAAHRKMEYVLQQLVCLGITTNQQFLLQLFRHPEFQAGRYHTDFIHTRMNLAGQNEDSTLAGIAATLIAWQERQRSRRLLRALPSGWRNNFYDYQSVSYQTAETELTVRYRFRNGKFDFLLGDQNYRVNLISTTGQELRMEVDGIRYPVNFARSANTFFIHNESIGVFRLLQKERFPPVTGQRVEGGYVAPMPCQIVKVLVKKGQPVRAGDHLVILSSMKMENTIAAVENGVIAEIYASEGTNVEAGFLLLKLAAGS